MLCGVRSSSQNDRRQSLRSARPKEVFPTTLKEFGYEFTGCGELKHKDTKESFQYHACNDGAYNQRRYNAIGELVTEYVYGLMENVHHLQRVWIPVDKKANNKKPQSFFFMSHDALTNSEKLLILIHGSGRVRAGQWSRRLLINEGVQTGSQLPFIERAVSEGYGVIVLNTNLNKVTVNGKQEPVKLGIWEVSSPEKHATYVWKKFVSVAKARNIAIIAHSYGGVITSHLMTSQRDFMDRVFAIAFTDASHRTPLKLQHRNFYCQNAINWVCSKSVLDTNIRDPTNDARRLSAGTTEHERTSTSSMDSVFQFLSRKFQAVEPQPHKKTLKVSRLLSKNSQKGRGKKF